MSISKIFTSLVFLGFFIFSTSAKSYQEKPPSDLNNTITEIKNEAQPDIDVKDRRPLPLMGHWNTGEYRDGISARIQFDLIEEGHHLLPWFFLPIPDGKPIDIKQYEQEIKRAAKLKLPISFISTQWEMLLTKDDTFFSLPVDKNPNVITRDKKVISKVSPFGDVKFWHEAGKRWTSQALMKKMQQWYPDPPLVLFVSNNEHPKLNWHEAHRSARFISKYGKNMNNVDKRKVIGDGWIERYRELQKGMRTGLFKEHWKKNARFIGYNAFGGLPLGRWAGWEKYSLHIPGRVEPWSSAWDGASVAYYIYNWDKTTDFTVWSPQIGAMNLVFMLEETRKSNPYFWFELSVWDGHAPGSMTDKRRFYKKQGQHFTPERYAGMTKFGMWLLRPRTIRGFRSHLQKYQDFKPYFMALTTAVDQIHVNTVLRRFWQYGRLVPNRNRQHPYNKNLPKEYTSKDRWFLLDTQIDPKKTWNLSTKLSVFPLALEIGEKPEREWLLYAFSPLEDKKDIAVTLPGYGVVKLDFSTKGNYFHLVEKGRDLKRI